MRSIALALCLLSTTPLGCAALGSYYGGKAEEEAAEVLARATRNLDEGRRDRVVDPTRASADVASDEATAPADLPPVLDLATALRIATERNRQFLRERESLEITALGLLGVRNLFAPRFDSQLAYSFSQNDSNDVFRTGSATVGVTQVLPTGGDLSIDARTDAVKDGADHPLGHRFQSSVGATVSQPLFRGAWNGARHEVLTQAERSLIYAVRDFELFRQDFTIRITEAFFDLISRKQVIENNRLNYEQNRFLHERSEGLFEVDRMTGVDKFRAEQEFLQAENRLLESEEDYALALDRFKIELGLPMSVELDVTGKPAEVRSVELGLRPAVNAALVNRLDVETARDRVEDDRRRLAIARQNLLPDLDLVVSQRTSWLDSRSFERQGYDESSYAAGVSLTLPLDRVNERHDYRESLIALARSEREGSRTEDEVVLDVRDALRRLSRIESSLVIQEKSLESDKKRLRISQLRLQEGTIGNRDVVEAQNSILATRNRIVELRVDHEIARLRLRRTLGTLFLDENGVPLP